MAATCVVTKNGSSASVVLPAAWRKRNNVSIGDVLEIETEIGGQITFKKASADEERIKKMDEMLAFMDSLPHVPWTEGDSPDDDKRTLGDRYV